MIAYSEQIRTWKKRSTVVSRLATAAVLASTTTLLLGAAAAPARLLGITAEGDAVVIESSEPAVYSISRPSPTTLVVDMRNVSIGEARSDVPTGGALAAVRLEQATAPDGRAIARVHMTLNRPSEHSVRSSRNTIRVELSPRAGTVVKSAPKSEIKPAALAAMPAVRPASLTTGAAPIVPQPPKAQPPVDVEKVPGAATVLERVASRNVAASTRVTLIGNGRLAPGSVVESKDRPRRLVLDFPNVSSKAATQTVVDSALVSRVRVGLNSSQPLITRVVMEIASAARYHVERSGDGGRDLDIVFEGAPPETSSTPAPAPVPTPAAGPKPAPTSAAVTPAATPREPVSPGPTKSAPAAPKQMPPVVLEAAPAGESVEPEAPISLSQAMANVAAITPKSTPPAEQPADAMAALKQSAPAAAPVSAPAVPAPPASAAPTQAPALSPTNLLARNQTTAPVAPPTSAQPPPAQPPAAQPPPEPPAPPAQPPQSRRENQPRQFSGHPISLDFEGVDLRAVLRTFADVSGLNMVIDPDVQGTVDIKLTDVAWDQALDVILRGQQLDYSVDGTIVRISKIATLENENKARQSAAQAAAERAAQAGGLTFETYPLSYAKAAEMAPLLKGSLRLSKYGQVQVDTRTNTLIIADLPDQFPAIRELLRSLDRAEPQVEVEARIVQTTRDFAKAIGVQWGLNGRVMPDIGNTTNLAFPNRGTLGGRVGTQSPNDPRATELETTGSAVRLGVPDATTAIGLALGAVNGAFNLDVALSALERTGKGRVLSTPRLTTQNNIQAEVAQGVQIPIQTVANETVTVTFKDAVLVLRVTPQITAAGTVIMKVEIENATADFSRQVNGIPPVDTQRALTQVQIDDGATTVIGGIFVSQEQSTSDKVPMLHRIPILGWLFKQDRMEDESRELLIFITPRILKG